MDRCKTDGFDVFLASWNATQNYKTPFIHFRSATWLQKCWERGEARLLLQAFRASGKSTLCGLFLAWLLTRDPDLRILVLSAEASLAEKMVRTVRKVIERHPSTAAIRPNNPDQWASDSFTVKRKRVSRDPSVLGRGLYANVTGARADVIVCDDVEVPNTCESAEKRAKLRERLSENAFILTPEGRQFYIGTPHSYYTIYADVPRAEIGEEDIFLKDFCRRTVPVLNAKGASAWPEKYPLEKIAEMARLSGPAKFNAQMMLVPVNIRESRLDPALLERYDARLCAQEVQQQLVLSINGKRLVSCSAWWDPAFGSVKNDASVLAVVYTDAEGKAYLHRVEYITVQAGPNEDEASLQCQRVAQIAEELFIPSITVETNGIGKFLPAILRNVLNARHTGTSVKEYTSRTSKADRILSAFDARMAARSLFVHADVYKTRFMTEMQEWNPLRTHGHDDGLDAAAGAIGMEPERIKRIYGDGARLWIPAGSGHTAETNFDV